MATRRRMQVLDDPKQETKACSSTPTVYHAATVIFLEFFAFGLLTTPMISVLDETFPKHTFLMNGIIHGVKGFLSFLSAPLLGALSDAIGRKPFLLLAVTFTCSPIPLMKVSHWWYFTMISISGIFAVTFSVALAYVADITSEENRSWGYGLVSATFAASLVTSPAIGAYLGRVYSEDLVVALATAIAFLDIFFILACVPESLPEKVRTSHVCSITGRSGGGTSASKLSWDKIDPFAALRKVTNDYLVLMVCITTFFSYLPEAGQYSCFFVYLRLVMGFSEEHVALFIALVGILSCITQTLVLGLMNRFLGPKRAIIVGLVFEAIQLTLYGFATQASLLWTAGFVAAMGMVTYPALSAFVSKHAAADQQGVAQGLVTGIRGLCGGLGPALFGLIFYIFQVDLHSQTAESKADGAIARGSENLRRLQEQLLPGPPFAFGAILVLLAILVAWFIPENPKSTVTKLIPTTLSGDNCGPIAAEAYEHIRWNMSNIEYGHSFAGYDNTMEAGDHDSYYASSSQALLPDPKNHMKHTRTWDKKDHAIDSRDLGLWDRLVSGWSDRRRRPAPVSVRRANRMTRYPPTVSFTRAHLVEPIRRLIGGWSVLGRSIDNAAHLLPSRSTFDHSAFSSGGLTSSSSAIPNTGDPGGSINLIGFGNYLPNHERDSQFLTRLDTEAADLSNYRSHNLKHFLHHSTPVECDVVTAHRFDVAHHQTRGFTADTTDGHIASDNGPGVMGTSSCDHNRDSCNSTFSAQADVVHSNSDDGNCLLSDILPTVPESVTTLVELSDDTEPRSIVHHSHHRQQFGLDESNRLAVLPT